MSHELRIKHVAQIEEADIRFGDLTVLVGPQATGKSILLQCHKLQVDVGSVLAQMERYGLDYGKSLPDYLDVFFGEGMHGVWRPNKSEITVNGSRFDVKKLIAQKKGPKLKRCFSYPLSGC